MAYWMPMPIPKSSWPVILGLRTWARDRATALNQDVNIMSSEGLAALGVAFGGMPLFERTVAELVEAASRRG